mmetsp:Transcript_6671/g.5796  ORF Transcript_6671/g.5796 Transcript_6671/m.5796 type:complete len:97 (-) Transcript_6671:548-838(-)
MFLIIKAVTGIIQYPRAIVGMEINIIHMFILIASELNILEELLVLTIKSNNFIPITIKFNALCTNETKESEIILVRSSTFKILLNIRRERQTFAEI